MLNDIDYIFISHAHNDHSADLESLMTLLHDYNEKEIKGSKYSYRKPNTIYQQILRKHPEKKEKEIDALVKDAYKDSPRHKSFKLLLSEGTYIKYKSYLECIKKENYTLKVFYENTIIIESIKAVDSIKVLCRPIKANHKDLMPSSHPDSVAACFGFVFDYGNTALIYTGDTGYSPEDNEFYQELSRHLQQPKKEIILLAHIGGFQDEEKYNLFSEKSRISKKAFYKNHLGRLGLIKLVEVLNPKLCIISEFGEEFRENCRVELSELLNANFVKAGRQNVFIPADIGLEVKFDVTIKAITKEYKKEGDLVECDFINCSKVTCFEDNTSPEYSLYYFERDKVLKNRLKSALEHNKTKHGILAENS